MPLGREPGGTWLARGRRRLAPGIHPLPAAGHAVPGPSDPAAAHLDDGAWRIHGHNLDAGGQPAEEVRGEAAFEMLPGGFFLAGRETSRFASGEHVTLMVFGWHRESGMHRAHFFDNLGFSRVYEVRIEDRVWTLAGRFERARVDISPDGDTLRCLWKRTEDGDAWLPLCRFTSQRAG